VKLRTLIAVGLLAGTSFAVANQHYNILIANNTAATQLVLTPANPGTQWPCFNNRPIGDSMGVPEGTIGHIRVSRDSSYENGCDVHKTVYSFRIKTSGGAQVAPSVRTSLGVMGMPLPQIKIIGKVSADYVLSVTQGRSNAVGITITDAKH
jgi:hypothetical protein